MTAQPTPAGSGGGLHRTPDDTRPDRSPPPAARTPQVEEALAELGRVVLDQPLGLYLQRVADLARHALPGVDDLSVTLVEKGRARSAAFSSPLAAMLDERQYEAGFGPCLDAAASGETLRVDMSGRGPYAAFAAVTGRHGVRAVVAVGMPLPHAVVGSLNLYSTTAQALDDDVVALARTFAGYAAVALANAALHDSTVRLAEQLQEAMRSRAVIEQAKGVLMARMAVDDEAAFAQLATASQQSNTKLRAMAADVVARAQRGETG